MRTISRSLVLVAFVFTSAGLVACSAGQAAKSKAMEENAVVHHVSESDLEFTHSKQALEGTSATLWVNGLGCPQCASNIDQQLKRTRGVTGIRTDLGTGKVYLTLNGTSNPSPFTLSERTLDAGFTLVKVEQP